MRTLIVFMVAAALLLITGCQPVQAPTTESSQEGNTTALTAASWQLTELSGEGLAHDRPITLEFDAEGEASGSDGCNRYRTSYTIDGDTISFGEAVPSTMMACDEAVLATADEYRQMLAAAATYAVEGFQLILRDDRGHVIAAFSAQSRDLADSDWLVTGYNNGQEAVVSVLLDTELTANFAANGELMGSGGCNNYVTTYTTNDNMIEIGPIAGTLSTCPEPDGVMTQEQQYLEALASASTYTVEGNMLEMRDDSDTIAVTFSRAGEQ